MRDRLSFYFGAGAEASYDLPSGETFTRKTILEKNKNLYDSLKEHYNEDRLKYKKNIFLKYEKEFIFSRKDNILFKELLQQTVTNYIRDESYEIFLEQNNNKRNVEIFLSRLPQNSKDYKTMDCLKILSVPKNEMDSISKKKKNSENNKNNSKNINKNETINNPYKTIYNDLSKIIFKNIFKDTDNTKISNKCKFNEEVINDVVEIIKKKVQYYGIIERYFNTIIDPIEYGQIHFWRVINYYWNAYFSILIPLLKKVISSTKDLENNSVSDSWRLIDLNGSKDMYDKIFKQFEVINTDLWKRCIINKIENDESYYKHIGKSPQVITTNYTPFLETLFDKDNVAYLAGKLNQFEFPFSLELKEITTSISQKSTKWENKFFFPFLMTQAPIKPIIFEEQIREYSKALKILDNTKYLLIVGYGINDNDNHVNAILKNQVRNGIKIIYFNYSDNNTDYLILEHSPIMDVEFANVYCKIDNYGDLNEKIRNLENQLSANSVIDFHCNKDNSLLEFKRIVEVLTKNLISYSI